MKKLKGEIVIHFKNNEWYLIKIDSGLFFSPSGYAIVHFVDGFVFEEQSENDISHLKFKIIKHLIIK